MFLDEFLKREALVEAGEIADQFNQVDGVVYVTLGSFFQDGQRGGDFVRHEPHHSRHAVKRFERVEANSPAPSALWQANGAGSFHQLVFQMRPDVKLGDDFFSPVGGRRRHFDRISGGSGRV